LYSIADSGMRLWWRIQRGGGGISYSRGFDLCLVLECEISLKVCVVEFDFCFLFIWLDHWIGIGSSYCERRSVFCNDFCCYLFLVSETLSCLLPWMILARCMSNLRFDLSCHLCFLCVTIIRILGDRINSCYTIENS